MNDPVVPEPKSEASPNQFVTGVVALSPFIALAAIPALLASIDRDNYPWAVLPLVVLIILSILVGFFGGLSLAYTRKSSLWVLATLASLGVVFLILRGLAGMGPAGMH